RRDDAVARPTRAGRGGDPRQRRLCRARPRAADARPAAPRRRRDDAGVHVAGRLGPRALAAVGVRRMRMNGADAILRCLEAEGIDVIFGIPGGAILPLYDAMA